MKLALLFLLAIRWSGSVSPGGASPEVEVFTSTAVVREGWDALMLPPTLDLADQPESAHAAGGFVRSLDPPEPTPVLQ